MKVRCPNCGHQGKIPDQLSQSGRPIRCPKCKIRFGERAETVAKDRHEPDEILSAVGSASYDSRTNSAAESNSIPLAEAFESLGPVVDEEPEFHLSPLPPPLKTTSPILADSNPPLAGRADSSAHFSPEPWFYKVIQVWAVLYLAIGVFVVFLGTVVTTLLFYWSPDRTSPNPAQLVIFAWLCGIAFFFFTVSAFIYLLLDLARNIRRLRLHADHRAETEEMPVIATTPQP